MKSISTGLRTPILGAAMLCCLTQFSYAEEVLTAPNASAPPQNQQTVPNGAAPPQTVGEPNEPPAVWNDTFIGYRWGTDFHYPGVPSSVMQNIGYLATIGGFKYGSYAFNVDYLVSNAANPEAGGPQNGGAQEVYSIGRVELSAGKIFGRYLGYGFIRDYGLTLGYEFGVKNDAYGERARMLVAGPTVEFSVPHGYWNLTAGVRTESNHNGITGVDVHFNPAWHIESSWLYPFRVGPVPLVFRGFASVTGPKGRDGFGVQTTTEFLTRVSLLADIGSFAGHPRTVYAGAGYEYWYHMYGSPTNETTGTITSAPMLIAEIHF
jgi:hypothetical protein